MSDRSTLAHWLRSARYTTREDAAVLERKQYFINRGTGFSLALLGPCFMVLNLMQGIYGLALINATSTLMGLLILLLNARGRYLVAGILLTLGGAVVFTISAYTFNNGMEYVLLLAMMGAVFMFNNPVMRSVIAGLNALGFIFVSTVRFLPELSLSFSVERYSLNLVIFILIYYWLLEVCRAVNIAYYEQVKEKNVALEEANQAREKLFSIIAHDLRGPVGNLKSAVDLMASGTLPPEQFQAILPNLEREVTSAYDCLDTLLVWSANQLGALRPASSRVLLAPAVETALALFKPAFDRKEVRYETQIPPEAAVWMDRDQFAAILRNLLSNALKFTPSGGRVKLTATAAGENWHFVVSDNGIGMKPEQIEQVLSLQPGNSTPGTENERGLGLGLQICRDFLAANGGLLKIDSHPGEGTRFHLTLPAARAASGH